MMNLKEYLEEDTEFMISKYNNITDITGPYETKVVHTSKRNIEYFDNKLLTLLLTQTDVDLAKDQRNNIYTVYSHVGGEHFKLTLNTNACLLEIVNMDLNITSNFADYTIPEFNYPIYQYTSNPHIIILAIMLLTCGIPEAEKYETDLMYAIENIIDKKLENDEDYYLDEYAILFISIYAHRIWVSQKDVMGLIQEKINEVSEKIQELEFQKMTGDDTYMFQAAGMFTNLETRIRKNRELLRKYVKLETMMKTLKETDEIMELKFGNQSYFMIRRNEMIMTIDIDEFKNLKTQAVDTQLNLLYQDIIPVYMNVLQRYNEWVDSLENLPMANKSCTLYDSKPSISDGFLPYCS